MEVTRSRFYCWQKSRNNTDRSSRDGEIVGLIRDLRSNKRFRSFGTRRLKPILEDLGEIVSRKRLRRLMSENNIKAITKRAYRPRTTDSRHDLPVAPNRLDRDFTAPEANRVWCGDITYLRCGSGFVYLAVVMDLYSRKIIGWSVRRRMHTKLVSDALNMALTMRGRPTGMIFHSDRGSQYASREYRKLLVDNKLLASMSRKGDCWDNSPVESFFASLKKESFLYAAMNYHQICNEVFEYIAVFYNRQRPHSWLDGSNPDKFEIKPQPLNMCA